MVAMLGRVIQRSHDAGGKAGGGVVQHDQRRAARHPAGKGGEAGFVYMGQSGVVPGLVGPTGQKPQH